MKGHWPAGIALCLSAATGCSQPSMGAGNHDPTPLLGPYLGMESPGNHPELFAPGIVADVMNEHSPAIFSPDGKDLFWSVVTGSDPGFWRWVMVHMEQKDGEWSSPRIFSLAQGGHSHVHSISPDGRRLFFSHNGEVLVSEKGASGWATPGPLPPGISGGGDGQYVFDLQEANSGNVYFVSQLKDGPRSWGIFVSEKAGKEYEPHQALGPNINSGHEEETPYIHPDERFILFASARPGGFGDQDIYISYRQNDGSWGRAINLGNTINTGAGERYPRVSPDGRYLFFVSTRTDFTDKESFDPGFLSLSQLKAISTGIQNGLGNIYWVGTESLEALAQTDRSRQ